jgi:hypothetical protein
MERNHMRPSGKQESRKAGKQESRRIRCDKAGTALLYLSINTKFLEGEKEKEKEKPNLKSIIT